MKTTDARRDEEGGQGRVCLSLCVCAGQRPTVCLGAPSHVFMPVASVQAASLPWRTALQPRLRAHSLTQAATPSSVHPAYTTLTRKHPPHLPICRTLHPGTHAPQPQSPSPSHVYAPDTHPHTAKPGTATCTCHICMPPHRHARQVAVTPTPTHSTHLGEWISLSHPYPTSYALSLSHTHCNRHSPSFIPVHACTCLYTCIHTLTSSQLFYTSQFLCVQARPCRKAATS